MPLGDLPGGQTVRARRGRMSYHCSPPEAVSPQPSLSAPHREPFPEGARPTFSELRGEALEALVEALVLKSSACLSCLSGSGLQERLAGAGLAPTTRN